MKWGNDLTFCVGEKMYAVTALETDGPRRLSLKVAADRFEELTAREDIIPAPYLARYHWVQYADIARAPRDELEELLAASHELVLGKLPTRKQREIRGS